MPHLLFASSIPVARGTRIPIVALPSTINTHIWWLLTDLTIMDSTALGNTSHEVVPAARQFEDHLTHNVPPRYSPKTEPLGSRLNKIYERRGRKVMARLREVQENNTPDVDPLTDEERGRIKIWRDKYSEVDTLEKERQDLSGHFDKYKNHMFAGEWGYLSEGDDKIDEEWFIPEALILSQDDPDYLCSMCRQIDFQILLSQRNLPGNQQPAQQTSIQLLGLPNVMDENSPCAFCRLLRRKIIDDDLLQDLPPDEYDMTSFHLNVVDDQLDGALRLEFEIEDQVSHRTTYRFLVHRVDGEDPVPRYGRPVNQSTADLSLLREWVHSCNENHAQDDIVQEGGHQRYLEPLISPLRVVDIIDGCVRKVNAPVQYACLSYVWGTGSQTQYTEGTRSRLESPGGLDYESDIDLPLTIRDAMKLTRDIGLRYIWIDALCIMQDDEKDKTLNIARMNSIYGNALLTIMASTNTNPTDGLPGISTPRPRTQAIERVQGMDLAIVLHDDRRRHAEIEDSWWNSRAWTFQERVLSTRAVFFTSSQMCFVCPHGCAFEDMIDALDGGHKPKVIDRDTQMMSRINDVQAYVWADPTQSGYANKAFHTEDGTNIMMSEDPDSVSYDDVPLYRLETMTTEETLDAPLIHGATLWDAYAHAVSVYTRRSMTLQSDAVNAFLGIADKLRQGVNTKFWYGMPEFALVEALMWQPRGSLKRRRAADGTPLFPSWSWGAWQGHVSYRSRGWYNAIKFLPASTIQWLKEMEVEELIENMDLSDGQRTEEEVEEYVRKLRSASMIVAKLGVDHLLHFDYMEKGWVVERDEQRNQHVMTHSAYPGVKLGRPICLPREKVLDLPSADGSLYFQALATIARFRDMTKIEAVRTPIQDEYLQVGLNDEGWSASKRRPWQRVLYHQGYRAGVIHLNVPLNELDLEDAQPRPGDREENTWPVEYLVVAISRDSLSHIAPPAPGWDNYWGMDPGVTQQIITQQESSWDTRPAETPNENAEPDRSKASEMGDPMWDRRRFGVVGIFDVYNVLLVLRDSKGVMERIGSGKMSHVAFHAGRPQMRHFRLR